MAGGSTNQQGNNWQENYQNPAVNWSNGQNWSGSNTGNNMPDSYQPYGSMNFNTNTQGWNSGQQMAPVQQQQQAPVQQSVAPAQNNTNNTNNDPAPWAANWGSNQAQAQRFANMGQFGRAKELINSGGGTWGDNGGQMEQLVRQEAAADDNYGGAWDWGGLSAQQIANAKAYAAQGQYGYAQQAVGGDLSKQVQRQLSAESEGNPYVKGESMGFDWGASTKEKNAGRLAASKKLAAGGTLGKAKIMYEKSGRKWDKNIARQMRTWAKGNK